MWYIILGLLAVIYLLLNLLLPSFMNNYIGVYVIRPLLWILLALIVYFIAKKEGLAIWQFKRIRKWPFGRSPFEAALLIAGFQISLLIIAGLIIGLGESPYSFTPFSIVINIVFITSALFGVELSRAYFIKKGTSIRRNITLILGLVTLLFFIIQIAPEEFILFAFQNPETSLEFLGSTVIPVLAMSLFASYLAYLGGAVAALGYMGTIKAFEWFSPVLPDLPWEVNALVLTIAPAIGFLLIQSSIHDIIALSGRKRIRLKRKDPMVGWTGVAVISVLFIFFSFGLLGVQPTVIYSGSMAPDIEVGDVVLISEVPTETLLEGDVIQFRSENVTIVHRVNEILNEGNNKLFITKGDANEHPDTDPLHSGQIIGKAVFTIPKVGWIPIAIKEGIAHLGIRI